MTEPPDETRVSAREFDRLRAVYRLTAALIHAAALEEIYDEALNGLLAAVGADRASVLVFDERGVMRFVAWRGLSDGYVRAVDGHSPWRPDAADARPIVVADAEADPTLEAYRDVILGEGIRALVFVPLVWEQGVLGKFMLYFDAPHEPAEADIRLAETIAAHVTLALVRRRADEALLLKTREFETLADHAPDVIARFDRELRHLYVNPAVSASSGIPRDRFIGRTNEELGMPAAVVAQWATPLREVFETGEPRRFEFRFPGVHGEQHFESALTPERDRHGDVVSVLAVTRDITARRRAEHALRLLAATSDVLLASLEPHAMLAEFCELLVAELGESCAVDLLAPHGEQLERVALHTRDAAKADVIRRLDTLYPTPLDAPIAPATATRTGRPALYAEVGDAELRAASRDDEQLALWRSFAPVSVLCAPLRARGRVLGAVTLASHDARRRYDEQDLELLVQLTDRVALALENAALYADAIAANRAKSSFLATMSHELRTPLNAILGFADIMATGIGGELSELQQTHLERIQASARHLLAIIEGLLSFSRLEAGSERIQCEPVDVDALVAEAVEMVRPAAAAKQLELRHDASRAVTIRTDRGKLLQIVLNLLDNAVKFTAHGSIAVATAVEPAQRAVRIAVRDSGVGIASGDLERVFEPFWQVESGMTRRVGGTGLGLTVSRRLARLLGGTLDVASEPGVGSVFTLRLPLAAPAPITAAPSSTAGVAPRAAPR
jgi:PAS domain S-box-containing protein